MKFILLFISLIIAVAVAIYPHKTLQIELRIATSNENR